jgi:hypothetical protein
LRDKTIWYLVVRKTCRNFSNIIPNDTSLKLVK